MWWDQLFSLFKCILLLHFVEQFGKYDFHFRYFILCSNRKGVFSFLFSSSGILQPNFPAIEPLLSLTGRHTAPHRPAGVLLFLDPLNCIHIESELIRIVQV